VLVPTLALARHASLFRHASRPRVLSNPVSRLLLTLNRLQVRWDEEAQQYVWVAPACHTVYRGLVDEQTSLAPFVNDALYGLYDGLLSSPTYTHTYLTHTLTHTLTRTYMHTYTFCECRPRSAVQHGIPAHIYTPFSAGETRNAMRVEMGALYGRIYTCTLICLHACVSIRRR